MQSRRSWLFLVAAAALAATSAPSASAQSSSKLFFIQRSKNANEVHYDARSLADGTLDPAKPVDGYWLNKAEDGSRGDISLVQRVAYGWDASPNGDGTWKMKLKAFPDRDITLLKVNGRWRAKVKIGGKESYMNRLYVATDESGMMPKVLYVDVFGEEAEGGRVIKEHIVK